MQVVLMVGTAAEQASLGFPVLPRRCRRGNKGMLTTGSLHRTISHQAHVSEFVRKQYHSVNVFAFCICSGLRKRMRGLVTVWGVVVMRAVDKGHCPSPLSVQPCFACSRTPTHITQTHNILHKTHVQKTTPLLLPQKQKSTINYNTQYQDKKKKTYLCLP